MISSRSWSPLLVSASLLLTALCAAAPGCLAQRRRAVNVSGTPGLPFSDGIVAGHTLYVSGTQGTDSNGKLEQGISAQTRAALENIRKVAAKAGFQMKDVVAVNVYLSDIHDFAAMNKVYATFFPDPKPTRTTVQVAALVNGAKIEISAIAVKTAHGR